MTNLNLTEAEVFQGQFGPFTLTPEDYRGVRVYRGSLAVAALSLASGTAILLSRPPQPEVLGLFTGLYALFCAALGVALWTIHIYLAPLHRALQICWAVGCLAAVGVALVWPEPLLVSLYNRPLALFGVGFSFVALTGLYFKEAFCFGRFEAKLLTPLVPVLLLGHWLGLLPLLWERNLLVLWALLFAVFVIRKTFQPVPPDVGDKTVYDYLRHGQAPTLNSST